jgi:hypothetical protein
MDALNLGFAFDDAYCCDERTRGRLYANARASHWDAATAINWSQQIDPQTLLGMTIDSFPFGVHGSG